MTTVYNVSSEGATFGNLDTTKLNGAIRAIDTGPAGDYVINITGQHAPVTCSSHRKAFWPCNCGRMAMQSINRVVISVALGVAMFGTPVCAGENLQLAGLWKLVAFHTEDVVTKERGAYDGEQPTGFMKLETSGKLSAWMASGWAETPTYRAVFYSGRYRLDPSGFLVRIEGPSMKVSSGLRHSILVGTRV